MKKLVWYVEDASGQTLAEYTTRHSARDMKKFYEENVFADWMNDVRFPVKIVREEWELIGKKVVR